LKKYVGEGPEEVHRIFRTARKYAPAVLFIDEIDAIAKERRGGEGAEGSEATLTALLTEMDGFSKDPSKPVFVLAATNFDVEPGTPKSLDPALTRRFDRHLYIDLPKREDRVAFLRRKREKNAALAVSDDLLDNVAMRSTGMSLAELDSMVEFSLRSAIREGATKVTDEIFEEAFETFNNGETKKWDEKELECTARHEAGHAFLCWHGGETPSYLTVVARGKHGGYMQHASRESKGSYTREELLSLVRTSLGGRAAELVYYGREKGVSTGASSDLAHATAIAKSILCTYGMDEKLGMASVSREEIASSAYGATVRARINEILEEQLELAIELIRKNRVALDKLVDLLMEKNHVKGDEIDAVLSKYVFTPRATPSV
jgi:ATP-dependent Zn protease